MKSENATGKNLEENLEERTLTAEEEEEDHCGSDGGLMHQSRTFRSILIPLFGKVLRASVSQRNPFSSVKFGHRRTRIIKKIIKNVLYPHKKAGSCNLPEHLWFPWQQMETCVGFITLEAEAAAESGESEVLSLNHSY